MNWKHILDIHDAWVKAENDGNFKEMARVIVEKLRDINFGEDFNCERDDIIEAFIDLEHDKDANVNEFDSLMDELYNFADTGTESGKLLWVKTF